MVAGSYHSHILKNDSTLWGCGENTLGQLSDGTMKDRLAPVEVMSNVKSVDAGKWHSLILQTNGIVWTCGAMQSALCGGYGVTMVSGARIRLIP
jgi:alpha-tubulin suppressor-like RCC1 family protein